MKSISVSHVAHFSTVGVAQFCIVGNTKVIIKTLGLHVGSKLDLSIDGNKIILTPVDEELSLETLLIGSPKACFNITDEDKEWLDAPLVGKEI